MHRTKLLAAAAALLIVTGIAIASPSTADSRATEKVISSDKYEVIRVGTDSEGNVFRQVDIYTPATSSGISIGDGQFETTAQGPERAEIKELPEPTGTPILSLTVTTYVDKAVVRSHNETLQLRRGAAASVSPDGHAVELNGLAPDQSAQIEVNSRTTQGQRIHRTIPIRTLSSNSVASATAVAYQYATAVQYQTFINDQYVPMDWLTNIGCFEAYNMGGRFFGGDNRTFRAPPAASPEWDTDQRYRSMQFAVVNWDNPDGYRMIVFKNVGTTRVYNSAKQLISSRKANSTNIQFLEATSSATYAQVRFSAVVGDPYCTLGAVRYNVMNRMYRSGLVETVGWKNQSPHHEIYARFNNSVGAEYWKTVGQWTNSGFHCLVEPACSNVTVSQYARAT